MHRIFFCVVLVLAIPVTGPAQVQASHGGVPTTTVYLPNVTRMLGGADGWQTPFIVQNVGSASANVELDFFSFEGTLIKTRSVSLLAPGTSFFHDPNSDAELPEGGQFAVVIRSYGSEIVAVVNQHQNVRNASRQESLSYSGLTSGSTHVYLPYLSKFVAEWLTTFVVQNLGSAPASVTITLASYDGTRTAQLTRTILPGRSQAIDPSVEPLMANGVEYAARIVSSQPVGVIVNAHHDAASVQFPSGFSYNGLAATHENRSFVPYVAKNVDAPSRSSRLLIQNIGLSTATPRLFFFRLGQSGTTSVAAPGPLAPGAVWDFDTRTSSQLSDGEYSLITVNDQPAGTGQFGTVNATTSTTTAMGFASQVARPTKLFLPNVTRALGSSAGWTTPFVIQSTGASNVTVRWYRFSDGQLVHTSAHHSIPFGSGLRIDPRNYPLQDDQQYAVVIDAATGGAVAVVTQLNQLGGDSAMIYEGFPRVPAAAFGTNGCTPGAAPSGNTFTCTVFGLPAGAAVSYTISDSAGATQPIPRTEPVAPDGSWSINIGEWPGLGLATVTVTAGGVSKSAQFMNTAATFAVAVTSSMYGSVSASTVAGAVCRLQVRLPSGSFSRAGDISTDKVAGASGTVSWTYGTTTTTQAGTGRHFVSCTVRDETHTAQGTFAVP